MPTTYAAEQWKALARQGYTYENGFMYSPDGAYAYPVPSGERRAAQQAQLSEHGYLTVADQ